MTLVPALRRASYFKQVQQCQRALPAHVDAGTETSSIPASLKFMTLLMQHWPQRHIAIAFYCGEASVSTSSRTYGLITVLPCAEMVNQSRYFAIS